MEEPKEQPDKMGSAKPTSLDHNTTQQPRSTDDIGAKVPDGKTGQPSKHNQQKQDGGTYSYRDLGSEPLEDYALPSNPRSWEAQRFPVKLAAMLTDPQLFKCVAWMPHGRSWMVLDRELFVDRALPKYFNHKNFTSFVRIVNAWGFRRILRGTDRDSYYHERFLRGRPDLRPKMKRLNATQCKAPASGNAEDRHPDFNAPGRYVLLPDEPGNKRSAAMRAAGLVPGTEAVASSGSWNMHDEGNASQIQQPMGRSHTVSVSPGMNMPAQSNADYNYMSNFMVSSSNREFNYGRQMDNMTSASVGISDREANYHEMERFYSRSNCSQSQFTTGYNRHQSMPANLPPHSDHSQFNMARMPASTNTMPQYNRSSSNPVPRQMPVRHDPDSSSTDVDEQLGNIQRIMMDNEALAARIKELEGRIGPGCVREPSHGGMAARRQCSQEMTPQTRQVPDPPGDFSTGRVFEETARGLDPVSYRQPLNDNNVRVDCKQQKRTPTKSSDDDCLGDFEYSFSSLGISDDNLNSFMSLALSDPSLVPLPEMDAAVMRDNEALAARIEELEGLIGSGQVHEPSHSGMAAQHQISQEMTHQARQVPDPHGDFSTGRAFGETARGQDPVSYRHHLNDSNVHVDCKQQKRMPTPTKSSDDDCSGDFEHSFNSNLNSFMSLGLSDSNLVPLPEMDAAEEAELGLGDVAEEAELKTRSSPTSSRDSPQADDNMESSVSLGMVDAMEGGGDSLTDVQWFQLQGT